MNRANQPAEFHFSDNELDALEGVLGAGTIIEKEQDSGCDLDGEEKERHPAKVVPDRLAVDWDFLLFGHGGERANRKTLVKPFCQGLYFHERPRVLFSLAQAFRVCVRTESGSDRINKFRWNYLIPSLPLRVLTQTPYAWEQNSDNSK